LQPEHLVISLLSKVQGIVSSHGLQPQGYFIVVPSYLSHYERKIIRRCGEIVMTGSRVSLVDDWVSLAADYAYSHAGELQQGARSVVFVDIGYSKCSFFVVEFHPNEPRLLDCEHLRFIGSKNMDQVLAEHYDQMMKERRGSEESVFGAHKAKVKLMDQVEKQRKVLSANEECHLNCEALF
jgi:heat shock 70kDa protein 4